MAKKKPVPAQTEHTEAVKEAVNDGYKYHATFTPTWRPEIDCGDHDSEEDAKTAVDKIADDLASREQFVTNKLFLAWRREDPNTWLATGHDGQVETNLPIAKITRVSAE